MSTSTVSTAVTTAVGMIKRNPRHGEWFSDNDSEDVFRFKHLCKLYDLGASCYYEYGTGDSEPDGVIQEAVWNVWHGRPHGLRECPKYWELYVHSCDPDDLERVAIRLVKNALPIMQFLEAVEHTPEMEKAVCEYCWRMQ
jgi:hypothetical protein